MFKKYSVFAGCIFLAILLAGCNHDKKYAENIYFHLEKSAKQESTFAKIQKELQQSSKKEQKSYETVLAQNIEDEVEISSTIQSAKKENQKQSELLQRAKKEFNSAYAILASARTDVSSIKNSKQKEAAGKLMKLAKKRNLKLETYYQEYALSIKINEQLYEDMLKNDFSAEKLDKQIKKLNQQYMNMNKEATAFNKATKAYNLAKSSYYHLTDLHAEEMKQVHT